VHCRREDAHRIFLDFKARLPVEPYLLRSSALPKFQHVFVRLAMVLQNYEDQGFDNFMAEDELKDCLV